MDKIAIGSYDIMKTATKTPTRQSKTAVNQAPSNSKALTYYQVASSKWIRAIGIGVILAFSPVDDASAQAKSNTSKIVGANECAECHKETAQLWKGTHHFTTFRKMPRSKEAKKIQKKMKIKRIKASKLCSSCHFTIQKKGKKTRAISGISCEKCHGAGKDFIKRHSEYSGNKKKENETKAQKKKRWKDAEKAGMIRPKALYKLAKNCYSCHVVPQEKLVNVGGHPAGSKFELVSWSQGEVRHNVWYTKGENKKAKQGRKRMMYLVGLAVEFETAIRAVGKATKKKSYAVKMARRAAAARKKMLRATKALPKVPELRAIIKLGKKAKLKLNNNKQLTAVANKIAVQTLKLSSKYNGSKFGAIDKLIPKEDKYKGKPAPLG